MNAKNKYDFTGKAIKCDTFKQIQHLAKIAIMQGLEVSDISKFQFDDNAVYFQEAHHPDEIWYSNFWGNNVEDTIVSYADFIGSAIQPTTKAASSSVSQERTISKKKADELYQIVYNDIMDARVDIEIAFKNTASRGDLREFVLKRLQDLTFKTPQKAIDLFNKKTTK